MVSPSLTTSDGGEADFAIYAFANAEAASRLMEATVAQVQCPSYDYELPEGTGAGKLNGFGDDYWDGRVTWTIRESLSVGGVDIPEAKEAFHTKKDKEFLTRSQGDSYGWRSTSLFLYEQHDRFVFVSTLYGECCTYGFSNSTASVTYTPTLDTLLAGMDVIRPTILDRLREAALL